MSRKVQFLCGAALLAIITGLFMSTRLPTYLSVRRFASDLSERGYYTCMASSKAAAEQMPSQGRRDQNLPAKLVLTLGAQQIAARIAELGFSGKEKPGTAVDKKDGNAHIFARLARTNINFDGQDIWFRMAEAPAVRLHLRGKFENGIFERIGDAPNIETFRFLDGDISIGEIETLVEPDKQVTLGTIRNDVLNGRANLADVMYGGNGCDTFRAGTDSGSDTIESDLESAKIPDLVKLSVPRDQVFERTNSFMRSFDGDHIIEFFEMRTTANRTARFLSASSLKIKQMRVGEFQKIGQIYAFEFADDKSLFPDVPHYVVHDLTLTRTEMNAFAQFCSGEKALSIPNAAITEAAKMDYGIASDVFAHRKYDFAIFSDKEILSRNEIAESMPACDFEYFMKNGKSAD